ncbi:MAG: beta galactosidase jelly roll domain-containing protein [Bacteroidetes bacterium]|nr:beta galactosidase jelly roll domain-containing protein [Bacteroidota bacterium]MCW5895144.1 beta galactosidase jelly roll domain-containing protein [Bacteroidota bacterium]
MKRQIVYRTVFLLTFTLTTVNSYAQELRLLHDLRGNWKFELGDGKQRAEAAFDDSKWESIYAPSKWEDEGFPGYDGYAWYRKHFRAEANWKDKSLYLRLGRIDDVDQVYVNGKFVGSSGSFPPAYETAYHWEREYYLPASYLNIAGDNVIAVRVYDDQLGGGMYEGRLGIYEDVKALTPEIQLAGEWRFLTGDDMSWKNLNVNDSNWPKISVPGYWEPQGHADYDGYAWYRTRFRVPTGMAAKRLILLLGMIDDFDETYLNGTLIGKTGTMGENVRHSNTWQEMRSYTIPSGTLIEGGENVLAIRVFDGYRDGGIYQGPIGIVTREKYLKWRNSSKQDWFDWIFR